MTMVRYGCILVIMTCFFVSVSSGGPVNDMITENRPSWFDDTKPFNPGYFNYDYVFFNPSGWFNYPNHIVPSRL